jgi:hypothetical protein
MPKRFDSRYPGTIDGENLSPEALEFAIAMERYMRDQRRRYPTWHEVLMVVRALGYRKVAEVVREPRPHSE